MKGIKLSIYAAALCAMVVGCTKDFEGEISSDETTSTNRQTLIFKSPTDNTNTQVSSKLAVESDGAGGFAFAWEENDVITIYNADTDALVGNFTCDDAEEGTFTGDGLTDQGNYIAVYPAATNSTLANRDASKTYNARGVMTQEGSSPTHLRTYARMKTDSFVYTDGETPSANFSHEMVYLAVVYIIDEEKEALVTEDCFSLRLVYTGGKTSTYQYLAATDRPTSGIHTLYFMVHPDDLEIDTDTSTAISFLFRYYNYDEGTATNPNYYSATSTITKSLNAGEMWDIPLDALLTSSYSLIYTEDELQTYSNTYSTTAAHTGVLMRDITMTNSWTMSKSSTTTGLTGTFDGNGKSITNLKVEGGSSGYVGMFNRMSGTVKNLTLIDPSMSDTGTRVGAIAGQVIAAGSIVNCRVEGGTISGNGRVGGIAGENWGSIEGCYNSATISSSSSYIGGIVGAYLAYASSSIDKIVACVNEGMINQTTGSYAGGIVGSADSSTTVSNTAVPEIAGCINRGSVTVYSEYGGGIAGSMGINVSQQGTIVGCYNEGSISSTLSKTSLNPIIGNTYVADVSTETVSSDYQDAWAYTIENNYYLSTTAAGDVSYESGVTSVESLSGDNISAMNSAIASYGYKYELVGEELEIVAID